MRSPSSRPDAEAFTLCRHETRKVYHFDVSAIRKHLRITKPPIMGFPITPEVEAALDYNGIEVEQLRKMLSGEIHLPREPLILAEIDGCHSIIDGNHRLALLCLAQAPYFPAWVVRPHVWRRYLLDRPGSYEAWVAMFASGALEGRRPIHS